jgi:hypothetical protein
MGFLISLRDCNLVRLDDSHWDLIYCNIQEDELEYFKYDISINDSFLYTKGLCGYWNSLDTYVYRFKETEYPIFSIEKIYQPRSHNVTRDSEF